MYNSAGTASISDIIMLENISNHGQNGLLHGLFRTDRVL